MFKWNISKFCSSSFAFLTSWKVMKWEGMWIIGSDRMPKWDYVDFTIGILTNLYRWNSIVSLTQYLPDMNFLHNQNINKGWNNLTNILVWLSIGQGHRLCPLNTSDLFGIWIFNSLKFTKYLVITNPLNINKQAILFVARPWYTGNYQSKI